MIGLAKRWGRGGPRLRIAYGRIFHEACAYSPLETEIESFERMHYISGEALDAATGLRGTELASYMPHAELTGFRQAAKIAGNVETIPLCSALAVPSGPLTRECFDTLLADLSTRLAHAGAIDGVYLALHGSMEVAGQSEAPEATILARVREIVGPQVSIAVSYDLHANLSPGLIDPVDVLIGYRSNPHWDLAPTGFRAGNRLIRTLRGDCEPVHAWRKLPLVLGGGNTISFLSPMREVFGRMKRLERDPRVLSASLFMVHPFTSADDLGWAAHVCTDGDDRLASELVDELADHAWSKRDAALPPMRTIDQALDEVASSAWRRLGPITLVDVDDIVGAGAPGGNTRFIEAMVRNDRGLTGFVPLHDPQLVEHCRSLAPGTRATLTLRGTPGYAQPVLEVEAIVAARDDDEKRVRLDIGGLHVVACAGPPLPIHPSFWKTLGLSPRRADFIVQKNFFHYRLFYATTSFRHIPVVSAGATSFERLRDRRSLVPTYPTEALTDWRLSDAKLRGLG